MFREFGDARKLSFQQILKHAERVVLEQVHMRSDFYDRNRIPVIHGRAEFLDRHTIKLTGKRKKLSADYYVIATGSRPYHPPGVDFSHPLLLDSDTILTLDHPAESDSRRGRGYRL